MFTLGSFFLVLIRFAIAAAVMFFAFEYGSLIGTVSLAVWSILESVFGTERICNFLKEKRPADGVDREVYDKLMTFADKSGPAIFAEQFFGWATVVTIYCLIGWKLDISPIFVLAAYVGSDVISWPYSLMRVRQAIEEIKDREEDDEEVKTISEQILEQVIDKYGE